MVNTRLVFAAVACLATTAPALAQSYIVPGVLNLHTGLFQPRVRGTPSAASTTYTGKFTVAFKITVASSIAADQPIDCSVDISATDSSFSTYTEEASAAATRSGSSATCSLVVPYSWALGSAPTYNVSYTVISAAAAGVPTRSSGYYSAASTPIPAQGATTALTISVKM